ncbi:MAG: deoxyguanosinetriphosphate triphosphohydrolase [Oscillospiraceae bacterium]|nr:deoxyguanosinetriphosphate triphosphohydrolase [Oscillospiraceae bacterium]
MNARKITEKIERFAFSSRAVFSSETLGRSRFEPPCDLRTEFQRDRDRIIHSKGFRRLKRKTQVFVAPVGDHFRTRLTHTLEVSQIARTAARALRVNEDLVEAISLGHDLGHTSFGHAGERSLNLVCPLGFRHYEQSVRLIEKLEKDGKGLNLTEEVKDGILCHTGGRWAKTFEGRLVRVCDKIAYINHDIDDAIRAEKIKFEEIPQNFIKIVGTKYSQRLDTMISSVVNGSSLDTPCMEPELQIAFDEVHQFMHSEVYSKLKSSEEHNVNFLIESLYIYFMKNVHRLPPENQAVANSDGPDRAVCDYIAGMTDDFAIATFSNIFIPKSFNLGL